MLVVGRAQAQVGYSLSQVISYTVPNSEEWSYISDVGGGLDIAMYQLCRINYLSPYADTLSNRMFTHGMRANFTYFPNDIAGQRIGVTGFICEPLLGNYTHGLDLEMDCGLAFFTNPFVRTANPQNVFIGSYLNCLIQLGLSYHHSYASGYGITLAAKFSHSSNGYLLKPNKGLNYLQAELGLRWPSRHGYLRVHNLSVDSSDFNRSSIFASYAPGIVMPRWEGASQKYFYAHTARLGWMYNINPKRAVGLNLDITYNFSHTAIIQHYNNDYKLPFYVGLAAAYETNFYNYTLHVAMARYLLRSTHGTTPFYERVGIFYNIPNNGRRLRHFVGVSLKSHMAHIDFIEWHYGIKFK